MRYTTTSSCLQNACQGKKLSANSENNNRIFMAGALIGSLSLSFPYCSLLVTLAVLRTD